MAKLTEDQKQLNKFAQDMEISTQHEHREGTFEGDLAIKIAKRNKDTAKGKERVRAVKEYYKSAGEKYSQYGGEIIQYANKAEGKIHRVYKNVEEIEDEKTKFVDLQTFLNQYLALQDVLETAEDFEDVSTAFYKKLKENNVSHTALFTGPTPFVKTTPKSEKAVYSNKKDEKGNKIPVGYEEFRVVMDGTMNAAKKAEEKYGITSEIIVAIERDFERKPNAYWDKKTAGDEKDFSSFGEIADEDHKERIKAKAMQMVVCAAYYNENHALHGIKISGMGLDSGEVGFEPELFKNAYKKAKDLGITDNRAHGGEEGPPSYIHDIIDEEKLDAGSIEHGNRAMEDEFLLRKIIERRIPMTMCPLSNLALKVQEDPSKLPIMYALERGVVATVNSDDAAYFGRRKGNKFNDIAYDGYVKSNFAYLVNNGVITSKGQLYALAKNSILASNYLPCSRDNQKKADEKRSNSLTALKKYYLGDIKKSITTENKDAILYGALRDAVKYGHFDILDSLIKDYKVDLNKVNGEDGTLLHVAARTLHYEKIKMLEHLINQHGADVGALDLANKSVLDVAAETKSFDMAEHLIKRYQLDPVNNLATFLSQANQAESHYNKAVYEITEQEKIIEKKRGQITTAKNKKQKPEYIKKLEIEKAKANNAKKLAKKDKKLASEEMKKLNDIIDRSLHYFKLDVLNPTQQKEIGNLVIGINDSERKEEVVKKLIHAGIEVEVKKEGDKRYTFKLPANSLKDLEITLSEKEIGFFNLKGSYLKHGETKDTKANLKRINSLLEGENAGSFLKEILAYTVGEGHKNNNELRSKFNSFYNQQENFDGLTVFEVEASYNYFKNTEIGKSPYKELKNGDKKGYNAILDNIKIAKKTLQEMVVKSLTGVISLKVNKDTPIPVKVNPDLWNFILALAVVLDGNVKKDSNPKVAEKKIAELFNGLIDDLNKLETVVKEEAKKETRVGKQPANTEAEVKEAKEASTSIKKAGEVVGIKPLLATVKPPEITTEEVKKGLFGQTSGVTTIAEPKRPPTTNLGDASKYGAGNSRRQPAKPSDMKR